ncbi:MAG: M23 family metallopeptidase [Rickettsiales bacterium]|jgi:LysM repeat protein|nr:M23 family metallopeptidase [Rickettsiales bacterium]
MKMKKILLLFCGLAAACDLRQKIVDFPESIGDFIAMRYPALLAKPDTEIYEYASVLDYGTPPESDAKLYGATPNQGAGSIGDYMLYADSGDYVMAKQSAIQTISDVSKDYGMLIIEEKKAFRLDAMEIKVDKGDTAYSIAKKYSMPVERLALLNGLAAPYPIKIGQTLKVENAEIITTKTEITKSGMDGAKQAAPVVKSFVKLPALPARAGGKFAWPVKGGVISDYGPKKNGLSNDGINISANLGATVSAAESGIVAYAGNELKGLGNLLILQHSGGWMTVYAHLDSFVVKRGDRVPLGGKIGTVGKTGKVSEPQLHFEIRKGSKAYDPKKELK